MKGIQVAKNNLEDDEIAMAGLEKAHVDQFENLGFPRGKVVGGDFSCRWYHSSNLSPPDRSLEEAELQRSKRRQDQ